jgi:hypothetical protein
MQVPPAKELTDEEKSEIIKLREKNSVDNIKNIISSFDIKSFDELKTFIKSQAEEHEKTDGDEEISYVSNERETFDEIVLFMLNSGFVIEGIDYNIFFHGINYDVMDPVDTGEEFDGWFYYEKLETAVSEMNEKNELPDKVKYLYDLYYHTFYPDYFL